MLKTAYTCVKFTADAPERAVPGALSVNTGGIGASLGAFLAEVVIALRAREECVFWAEGMARA